MACLKHEELLALAEGGAEASARRDEHLADCTHCRERLGELEAGLARLDHSLSALEAETPQTLEPRLRWRLKGAATTLRQRPSATSGLGGWLVRNRVALLSGCAALLLVALAFLFGGPTQTVSAAQILERSQASLFQSPPAGGGQRVLYRVRYEGPRFGALPQGAGEYLAEEVWDRGGEGRFKLTIAGPDGSLVRGISQQSSQRRIVFQSDEGAFDLRFKLADGSIPLDLIDSRRRQIGRSFFDVLLRAADPERLSHSQSGGIHVLEIGPRRDSLGAELPGVFELDRARLEVDEASFRLGSADLSARLFGEPVRIEATIVSVEMLEPGELHASHFEDDFEAPAGAVVLEGEGSHFPLYDVLKLILGQAHASLVSPLQ